MPFRARASFSVAVLLSHVCNPDPSENFFWLEEAMFYCGKKPISIAFPAEENIFCISHSPKVYLKTVWNFLFKTFSATNTSFEYALEKSWRFVKASEGSYSWGSFYASLLHLIIKSVLRKNPSDGLSKQYPKSGQEGSSLLPLEASSKRWRSQE